MSERFTFFPDSEEMFEGIDYVDLWIFMDQEPNLTAKLVAEMVLREKREVAWMALKQKSSLVARTALYYDDLVVTIMREDPGFDENNFIELIADTVVRAEYQVPLNQEDLAMGIVNKVRTLANFIRRRVEEKWRTGGGVN